MATSGLKVDSFDYALPEELIAQEPAPERTDARMLVVDRKQGRLTHSHVSEIGAWLQAGDVLVVNNTKVIRARVYGHKADTGGNIELLLLEPLQDDVWQVLCRAGRQPQVGAKLVVANGRITATVLSRGEGGRLTVRLQGDAPLFAILEEEGDVPLPPYIRRKKASGASQQDGARYQTVYASQPGAVAAPTAGLHFTPELLAALSTQGVQKAEITLHVGIGTFRPVSVEDVDAHRMDEERYVVDDAAADAIRQARARGGRVVAVGSTSVRTLETVVQRHTRICADRGRSDLFIYPPYAFRAVDVMLTNFHLPRSTLLMMVSALAGTALIQSAYEEAVRARYRFFSYGDCMLIL